MYGVHKAEASTVKVMELFREPLNRLAAAEREMAAEYLRNLHPNWRWLMLSNLRMVRHAGRTGSITTRSAARGLIKQMQRELAKKRADVSLARKMVQS